MKEEQAERLLTELHELRLAVQWLAAVQTAKVAQNPVLRGPDQDRLEQVVEIALNQMATHGYATG